MSKLTATTMKEVIEKILTSHGLIEQFNAREDFHVKIENEPYMPLTIEKHSRQVIVAHNYVQNGDLIPDPDMEFWIEQDGAWSPVAIQFATGHYRQCMDGVIINERERRDQVSFSNMWARNLKAKRFAEGRIIRTRDEQ